MLTLVGGGHFHEGPNCSVGEFPVGVSFCSISNSGDLYHLATTKQASVSGMILSFAVSVNSLANPRSAILTSHCTLTRMLPATQYSKIRPVDPTGRLWRRKGAFLTDGGLLGGMEPLLDLLATNWAYPEPFLDLLAYRCGKVPPTRGCCPSLGPFGPYLGLCGW